MINKKRLLDWTERIAYALQDIPAGHDGGVRTVSAIGAILFQKDVKEFRQHLMLYCFALKDENEILAEAEVAEMEAIKVRAIQSLKE